MRTTEDCYNWVKQADPSALYFLFRPEGNYHCSPCPSTYTGGTEGLTGTDCNVWKMLSSLDLGSYTRVRHVPAGNIWHPVNDNLEGTELYGDPQDDHIPWSIRFDQVDFDEFAFVTGDKLLWLKISKSELLNSYYTKGLRTIDSSSISSTPYKARFSHRLGNPQDPWVSLKDNSECIGDNACMLYAESSTMNNFAALERHEGADVYINAIFDVNHGGDKIPEYFGKDAIDDDEENMPKPKEEMSDF